MVANFLARGSALLSALFLMTLVAIAATAMSTHLQLDIYRMRLSIQNDTIMLASQIVEFWAMDALTNPKTQLKLLDEKGRVLDYPTALKTIYPEMQIEGHLYDMQSRFNINNLQENAYQSLFFQLLKTNAIGVESKTLRTILDATVNWVNPYKMDGKQAAWAAQYNKEKPPYLPANQSMQSVSEFRLVAGVTAPLYLQMLPAITALPTITSINLNTVSRKVLKALGTGLTDSDVDEFIELRNSKGTFQQNDLPAILAKLNISSKGITTVSEYFLSVANVKSKDLNVKRYALLRRMVSRTGEVSMHIIRVTLNDF
jgi:general secretion pathway protein K